MPDWPSPPADAAPWPERIPEPSLNSSPPALDVPDGLYCRKDGEGRLRLLACVRDGLLESWLLLSDGEGCYKYEGFPWSAQRYHADGRLEDFARDDDTSAPYPTQQSFLAWARSYRDRLASPPPPLPEWMLRNQQAFEEMKAGDRPPARLDRVLSLEAVPENLEDLLPTFAEVPWHSPAQCHERLLHYFHWEPELARDFTNFAPAACASAGPVYLYPAWEADPGAAQAPLADVPLFVRVRRAAEAAGSHAWVRALANCRAGEVPLVWTVPPAGVPGFRRTRVCVELLLRQEAGRGTELRKYLERVDPERFFAAASLAGAFLQSPRATSDLGPEGELADLVASLTGSPILEALGEWVHRQAGGGPAHAQTAHGLGTFVNQKSDEIRDCLAELGRGELYWPGSSRPTRWPSQTPPRVGPQRERAQEFLDRARLELGPRRNRFLLRAQTAARLLVQGPWRAGGVEAELLDELSRFLEERPAPASYRRWFLAAEWALREETEDPRLSQALARMMLSAL